MKRRTLLRVSALGLTGSLTGCVEEIEGELKDTDLPRVGNVTPPADADESDEGPGAIESLFFEDGNLVLRLGRGADVDEVKVVDPGGELWDSVTVPSGAAGVDVEMLRDLSDPAAYGYVEGTYAAAALSINRVSGVERVGFAEFEVSSGLKVLETGVDEEEFRAYVTVKNESEIPVKVTYLGFEDVKNPTPPPERDSDTGAITDTRIRGHGRDGVIIPASGEERLVSDWFPFEISGGGAEVPPSFTVVVETLPVKTFRRKFSRTENFSGTA